MASSISPGGKRGRSSSNGRPSLLISYLSEQPSTICTVLVSLSLLSIAVIAIILVIILSSKIILCFQIPFHRRRHFLPTSDSATTPCLFISVLFSSSCKRPVLKVKAQDQAIKFWVQSEWITIVFRLTVFIKDLHHPIGLPPLPLTTFPPNLELSRLPHESPVSIFFHLDNFLINFLIGFPFSGLLSPSCRRSTRRWWRTSTRPRTATRSSVALSGQLKHSKWCNDHRKEIHWQTRNTKIS